MLPSLGALYDRVLARRLDHWIGIQVLVKENQPLHNCLLSAS